MACMHLTYIIFILTVIPWGWDTTEPIFIMEEAEAKKKICSNSTVYNLYIYTYSIYIMM